MAEVSRKAAYYGPVFLLFLIFSVSIFGARDPYYITGLLLACRIGLSGRNKALNLTWLDCAVAGIWLYEAVLLFTSIHTQIAPFRMLTISVLFYWTMRVDCRREKRIRSLFWGCSSLLCVMSLIAAVSFGRFARSVSAAGFDSLYDFRFLYNSLGYLGNVWGNLLLGFLGIIVLTAWYYRGNRIRRVIAIGMTLPIVWGIVHTFSRGVYLAFGLMLVVFGVVLWGSVLSVGRKLIYSVLAGTILVSMAVPRRAEVWQTLRMVETVSQQRSFDGRIDGAQAAWAIVHEYPVTGAGSGNYALAADEYLYEDDYTPFTPIASGTAVQLPVEKGLIGLLLWLAVPIAATGLAIRARRRDLADVIVLATLGAVLLRETTFPALLDYGGMQILVFTLLAAYGNHRLSAGGSTFTVPARATRWIIWLPLIVCVGIFVDGRSRERNERINRTALRALSAGDWAEAEKLLGQAGDAVPYRLNRSALYWRIFKRTDDETYLYRAEQELREAAIRNPKDLRIEYGRAVILDAAGQNDSAKQLVRRLVERFPNNALYRVTLFEMLYRERSAIQETEEQLTRAIELAPGLLDTPLWRQVQERDRALAVRVESALRDKAYALLNRTMPECSVGDLHITQTNHHPNDCSVGDNVLKFAHFGKIMFIFRDRNAATVLLRRAVEALPNLSKPWSCLAALAFDTGDTVNGRCFLRRARFLDSDDELTRRLTAEYDPNHTIHSAQQPDRQRSSYPYRFLYRSSRLKFDTWYGAVPLGFEYIGSEDTNLENVEEK